MPFVKEENIGKISFISSVLLVVLLTVVLGTVFLHEKYDSFQTNLARVEEMYISLQKERLKSEIDIEVDRIDTRRQRYNTAFFLGQENKEGRNLQDQPPGGAVDESELKRQIITDLRYDTIRTERKEYLFVYQIINLSGGDDFATLLVNPNRTDLVGRSLSDSFTDAKGTPFLKLMLKGIRDKGEVFVYYWYKKPHSDGIFPKVSYFRYYPDWKWVIGKGTYLDVLDERVLQMQQELRDKIKQTILFMASVLFITCSIFLWLAYIFSSRINRLFEAYKTTQKRHRKRLEHLNKTLEIRATTDSLTKVYNRAYFNDRLLQEISRVDRYHTRLGLILFDIDFFKQINDTHGHLEGDRVLKRIARLCRENIRTSDILARWGGEEFVILIPENSCETDEVLAEKLRLIIQNHPFSDRYRVTCSFGVTGFISGEKPDEFIKRADKALYKSKKAGKNTISMI